MHHHFQDSTMHTCSSNNSTIFVSALPKREHQGDFIIWDWVHNNNNLDYYYFSSSCYIRIYVNIFHFVLVYNTLAKM